MSAAKRKRSDGSPTSPSDAASASPATPAPKRTTRRPKSSQACQACRKHKTRCELLDSTSFHARCHRCEVLSIPCSFETDVPRSVVFNDPRPLSQVRQETAKALLAPSKTNVSPDSTPDPRYESTEHDDEGESPWDFLTIPGLSDWTDTPVLGMRILSRSVCPDSFPKYAGTVSSLSDVITVEQKRFLLDRFTQQYEPWLSLPPHALVEDEILDLVRCTIASRHLDALARAQLFPPLRQLVEQVIMQHVFNPSPSIAVVQAFAILSLWSPFDNLPPSMAGSHDSRLIAASAVSMGKTLRLNESEDKALELQQRLVRGCRLTLEEAHEYPQLMTNCSMWLLLRVVESMACLGTGRPLTASSNTELDVKRYGAIADTLESTRRTRLLLYARIFELADRGIHIEVPSDQEGYESFYDSIGELLNHFEILYRVVAGLPVASDFDRFYLETLSVSYYFCKLVVLVRILRILRINKPKSLANNSFLAARWHKHGSTHAVRCARLSLIASDAMLAAVLATNEKELLTTAPDAFFSMIAFAGAFLVMAKFMLLTSQNRRRIPGCTDQLLVRTVKLFNTIAPSSDHPAARCAKIMSSFIETWDARLVVYDAEHARHASGDQLPAPRDGMGASPTASGEPAVKRSISIDPTAGLPPEPGSHDASSIPSIPMPELSDFNLRYDSANFTGFGGDVFGSDFWQFMAELPVSMDEMPYMYQTQTQLPPQ